MPRRPTVAGVPADLAVILRDIGALVLMQAALMTFTVLLALAFEEFYVALAFLIAAGITAGAGGTARKLFANAPNPVMKHGMVIAAGGWFATAIFGAIPFFLAAHLTPASVMNSYVPAGANYEPIRIGGATTFSSLAYYGNPLHAVFESMSGWTGSGLTMAVHEPSLPRAIQWWRSLIQWVGGVGVIVLTTAILARPGSGSYALYRAETREERIHPSIVHTVQTVWRIFLLYTILAVVLLFGAIWWSEPQQGLFETFWQSLNHAMTALSTGGFSVTDNSIQSYDSPLVEGVLLPIMALGAIAFPIHYLVLHDHDFDELFSDLQTRWLFFLFVAGSLVLSVQNIIALPMASEAFTQTGWLGTQNLGVSAVAGDATRDSVFQFISALTCTGFQSSDIGNWSAGGKLIISGAMVLGGAAGSTVGGIKIIRGYMISKGIQWEFSRVFLPASAVVNTRVNGRKLDRNQMYEEFSEAAIVSMLWIILLITGSVVLVNVAPGFGYADALFEVASAQGNVGLSTGIVGPAMSPLGEGMLVLNMWVGRLEIIPILVFIRSALFGLNP
ncbi:trk system potassium uptake protein TrkH [Haladaptatus litoreus]|uniref:Trk system potassium uptake protein TrkH n=1 Tax=Haladaptatus litoreus TaxID=553468 RepID=A0A1N6ZXA9_9EURY|nr:TrkH family potassium uptake protein [Haladaptatus litoreus]SIR31386.1 trk system potassium uptake protein TrkH [Haladaptatus litoreus]